MLPRNLDPPKLCNGTRLTVEDLHEKAIEAIVITGCARGDIVLTPRITLIPVDCPFEFKIVQFPLKVCTPMTVDKSRGQSFGMAGVESRGEERFSRGQIYVACSRVGSISGLVILVPGAVPNTLFINGVSRRIKYVNINIGEFL